VLYCYLFHISIYSIFSQLETWVWHVEDLKIDGIKMYDFLGLKGP
jgi:hypothetical protein